MSPACTSSGCPGSTPAVRPCSASSTTTPPTWPGSSPATPGPPRYKPRSHRMSNADEHAPAANSGQQPPKSVKIAFVLYPGFTALDIIGPFDVLAFVPGHEVVFVAAEPGPVTDDTGRCQLIASASFDQLTAPDVVVIGGTLFNKEPDQPVVQWLRQVHPTTTWTTSVCTGSIYLAAAGILDEQDATTHWAYTGELERHGAHYTG